MRATLRPFRYRIHVEMAGILPHAWVNGTADYILGPSCWVQRIGTGTASRSDMGRFSVVAWTDNPEKISWELLLGIPEPPAPYNTSEDDLRVHRESMILEVVSVLDYPVVVHLLKVEDREAFTDILSDDASSGDDSNDPPHDPGSGPSQRRPRFHTFDCVQGVVDSESAGRGPAGSGGMSVVWTRVGGPPVTTFASWRSDNYVQQSLDASAICMIYRGFSELCLDPMCVEEEVLEQVVVSFVQQMLVDVGIKELVTRSKICGHFPCSQHRRGNCGGRPSIAPHDAAFSYAPRLTVLAGMSFSLPSLDDGEPLVAQPVMDTFCVSISEGLGGLICRRHQNHSLRICHDSGPGREPWG
ncbi:hypothetical protein BRADI_4g15112v3 [Brachypodium distachyon]|uniref:Uncharacterized protein n=1 Tax=Brachypodium distachyon TaxID=15368 RepID=A0A0Q3HI38_BRADI|nr:hypothetical protein BRADI_4g15112v3 [Brachypodium distachyon]